MIARQGRGARKQAIPFGPFLALGGVVGLWFGDDIVDWYLDTFASRAQPQPGGRVTRQRQARRSSPARFAPIE